MNNTNKTIMTMSDQELRAIKSDECTLKQLFEGEKGNDKIIVPDLQRDYCWGTTADLVSDFIDNIINLAKEKASEEQIMGLLYGYTTELAPRHIQLCDGQQRLTTLFLLIGMLNRRLDNCYKSILISDFEFSSDDQEPHLQYSIRESSLYFLSDLTCQFFLNDKEDYSVEDISNQSWFLNFYHLDPTIGSILAALKTIDEKLNDTDVDLKNLAEFVLNKLKFLYYDMENRHNGEETFVLINTTGEPLSSVQNQKPKFIQANQDIPDVSKKWEDMETWFWQNRNKKQKPAHTADEGMQVFFSIIEKNLGVNPNDGKEVFAYFDAYKRIYQTDFSERYDEKIDYHNYENSQNKFLFALLPTLKYCYKFKDAEDNDLKRIYHLFFNQTRFRLDYTKVDDVIPQIDLMSNKFIDSLLDFNNKIGDEENRKLKILSKLDPATRLETELLFAEAESNKILSGRLSILLDWSNNNVNKFKQYFEHFKKAFSDQDLLRRALLAKDTKFWGVENLKRFDTLWTTPDQWYKLLNENSKIFQEFCTQDDSLKNTIKNYNNESLSLYPIIKYEQYLEKSEKRIVHIYPQANVAIIMKKSNVNAGYKFICNGKNFDPNFLPSNWKTLWCWQSIIFSDHKKSDVSIDVIVTERNFCITLLTDKNRWNAKFDLEKFATEENRNLQRYNDGSARYIYHSTSSVDEVFEKMKELAELVEEFIGKSK